MTSSKTKRHEAKKDALFLFKASCLTHTRHYYYFLNFYYILYYTIFVQIVQHKHLFEYWFQGRISHNTITISVKGKLLTTGKFVTK